MFPTGVPRHHSVVKLLALSTQLKHLRENSRFNSARAKYTAAVCAAGPLPMITTLLCIPLAALPRRRLPVPGTVTVEGVVFFWKLAAAAIDNPVVEERREETAAER